jgi:hypothetical protein
MRPTGTPGRYPVPSGFLAPFLFNNPVRADRVPSRRDTTDWDGKTGSDRERPGWLFYHQKVIQSISFYSYDDVWLSRGACCPRSYPNVYRLQRPTVLHGRTDPALRHESPGHASLRPVLRLGFRVFQATGQSILRKKRSPGDLPRPPGDLSHRSGTFIFGIAVGTRLGSYPVRGEIGRYPVTLFASMASRSPCSGWGCVDVSLGVYLKWLPVRVHLPLKFLAEHPQLIMRSSASRFLHRRNRPAETSSLRK